MIALREKGYSVQGAGHKDQKGFGHLWLIELTGLIKLIG